MIEDMILYGFSKDVEQVYIGKRVDNSKKKNESTKFKEKII